MSFTGVSSIGITDEAFKRIADISFADGFYLQVLLGWSLSLKSCASQKMRANN